MKAASTTETSTALFYELHGKIFLKSVIFIDKLIFGIYL
jgi:hypothetical protein